LDFGWTAEFQRWSSAVFFGGEESLGGRETEKGRGVEKEKRRKERGMERGEIKKDRCWRSSSKEEEKNERDLINAE